MNNMEEKLWAYIDGNCMPEEQKSIAALITSDKIWRNKYEELLGISKEFAAMELDEPPMAFTYNVMEAIRAEEAMVPLKAQINKRIIWSIGVFFVFTILSLLVYIIAHIDLSTTDVSFKTPATFKMPDIKNYISKPVLEVFFFIDVVVALFLADAYLRSRKVLTHE